MVTGAARDLELWGGVECTVNRLDDRYLDQSTRSGHEDRDEDLVRFANVGFKALRTPLLWERMTGADGVTARDWSAAERRLGLLRELGIRPIAGLLHHGSGPFVTNLLDPNFAPKLANYARRIAERFPWIEDYTPVNEPLTTARFSALYGHWYPHARDPLSFARALFNQLKGVVLAMREIRQVNPAARLVQTEDLGKIYSTPALAYQAEFENHRRWLTFDLLLGRVDSSHPMWAYFRWVGVEEAELEWFLENTCPPDILGLNYYVVGERLLDERTGRYPGRAEASNGRDTYVDVSAVRAVVPDIAGPGALLNEVIERYRLPIAVTEAHLSCTREEQMRWVMEVWNAARTLREGGADIRAVTLWSLLGAFDWNTLITRDAGRYETGLFDLRAPEPRPTALVALATALANHGDYEHPVLSTPGWWRRDVRLLYPGTNVAQTIGRCSDTRQSAPRPLLIAGGTGILADTLARLCEVRGLAYRLLDGAELDVENPVSVRRALHWFDPWAVINAHELSDHDQPQAEHGRTVQSAAETLSIECRDHGGIPLLMFSSDAVFDGATSAPYDESSVPDARTECGRNEAQAERRAMAVLPCSLIIRSGPLFGPWDETNRVTLALDSLATGRSVQLSDDERFSPTYAPDLVHASLDLLIDRETGIWHLANAGSATWMSLLSAAADQAGISHDRMVVSARAASHARSVQLTSRRGWIMRPWQEALVLYQRDRQFALRSRTRESLTADTNKAA